MGNLQDKESPENGAMCALYGGYEASIGGVAGGSEGGFGHITGAADTLDYGSSFMSSAKKQLIRDIADIMSDHLKVPGLKGKKSLSELVAEMKKQVPDPRRSAGNGQRFTDLKPTQVEACKVIAKAINQRMGDIIDLTLPSEELCLQVAEIMHSLFSGLTGELAIARADIHKTMKYLDVLKEILKNQFSLLEQKILSSNDCPSGETKILREVHKDVMKELERQLKMLQLMFDTLVKYDKHDLNELLKESTEFKRLVKKIRKFPGTAEFGRKIAYSMGTMRTAAQAAEIVDKALTNLGISYAEYAKATEIKDLTKLLSAKTISSLNKGEKHLMTYEKAKKALYTLHYAHDGVIEELKKKPKKGADELAIDLEDIMGGVEGGLKIDKRVKKRGELKKALVKAFNQNLASLFQQINTSAKFIAKSFSTSTATAGDKMQKFVKSLELVPELDKKYTYFSVIGVIDNIRSRQEREQFIGSARFVISTIEDLLKSDKTPGAPHLKDMKDSFQQVIDLITSYAKKFSEGFGPIQSWKEFKKSDPVAAVGGDPLAIDMDAIDMVGGDPLAIDMDAIDMVGGDPLAIDMDAVLGGDPLAIDMDAVLGGDVGAQAAKIGTTLKDAINIITYFHRIAMMRHSMSKASKEIAAYKSDYVKILATAIADGIDKTIDDRNKFKNHWNEIPAGGAVAPKDVFIDITEFVSAYSYNTDVGAARDALTVRPKKELEKSAVELMEFYDKLYDAKINMYRVAEAIDIYAKEFTDGISNHPDDIQDIMAMLSNVEINTQWFNDRSGDIICAVYDAFPSPTPVGETSLTTVNNTDSNDHYYTKLNVVGILHGDVLGATDIASRHTDIKDAHVASKVLEKALGVENHGALKNLIATFVSIGEKFGGSSLIKKTHMSSKLILKYLKEYVACSAFRIDNTNYKTGTYNQINSIYLNMVRDHPAFTDAKTTSIFFQITDKLFELVIKTIASKILTVVGTYNMLHKPINKSGLGYNSDLRLILGGYEGTPKIIDNALDLYVRLPLLVEFYRSVFEFKTEGALNLGDVITMIPEMDGTFSGIIQIIFERAKSVTDGNYSESEIRMLISEINKIYSKFSSSKNPVSDIINEFVAEINRRYGVASLKDREAYLKMKKDDYDAKYTPGQDLVDFELKGIDEEDVYRRPAPSDAYITEPGYMTKSDDVDKYKLNDLERDVLNKEELVNGLRVKIDNLFREAEEKMTLGAEGEKSQSNLSNISFTNLINSRRNELKHATSEDEKYNITRKLIQSMGTFASASLERSYILFHETIASGLNTLYGIYKLLSKFKLFLRGPAKLIETIYEYSKDYDGGGFITGDFATRTELFAVVDAAEAAAAAAIPRYGVMRYFENTAAALKETTHVDGRAGVFTDAIVDADLKLKRQAYTRYCTKYKELFKDLFEALFSHTSGDLIRLKIDIVANPDTPAVGGAAYIYGSKKIAINVDYSKLRETVYKLFNTIKLQLDKYRGLLPNDVIASYEDFNNEGSVYWLEKKLIDEMLEGKSFDDKGLDTINHDLGVVVDHLFKEIPSTDGTHSYIKIYEQIAEILYINNASFRVNQVAAAPVAFGTNDLIDLLYDPPTPAGVAGGLRTFARGALQHMVAAITPINANTWFTKTNLQNDDNALRSLVHMFNKIYVLYLKTIYDGSSKSVYLPTLNKFANGSFSTAIYDRTQCLSSRRPEGHRTKMQFVNHYPIYDFVAFMTKALITDKTRNGKDMLYGKSDLSDIPMYVRESLKSNLPVFEKMFSLIIKRADMLKQFAQVVNLYTVSDRINGPAAAGAPTTSMIAAMYILAGVDRLILGCHSLKQCIKDTLHDLGDSPKYLETYSSFISDYESLNGKPPFMPTSSIFTLANLPNNTNHVGIPIYRLGAPQFKILFGTRGILHKNDVSLSDAPGMSQLLKDHNATVDPRHSLDTKHMEEFISSNITLLKYVIDSQVYKPEFALPEGYAARSDIRYMPDPIFDTLNAVIKVHQLVNTDLSSTLKLTESNNQKVERNIIVKKVESSTIANQLISSERKHLIAYNIIDLNIVPINLHALMREIPLINLYNYAYTFDHYIDKLFGVTTKTILPAATAPKDILAKLIVDPYFIPDYLYLIDEALISDNVRNIEGLGVPKYIVDELLSKAAIRDTQRLMNPGGAAVTPILISGTRINTKLMRDLIWIPNIVRIVRLQLRRDLVWYNSKVVSDHAVVASSVTELFETDLHEELKMTKPMF